MEAELTLKLAEGDIPVVFSDDGMEWAAEGIGKLLPRRPQVCIIGDSTVALLYERALMTALQQQGFEVLSRNFEPGEPHKNLRTVSRLLDALAEQRFARDDVVVGLGGGASTDVAGFVAAVYQRGIRWIAVPTSLMGMADAAIGGKTGVDHLLGKNLIGAFHQPLAVLAPVRALDTLPAREWISGSAEVVKAALLSGSELWNAVQARGLNLFSWPREPVLEALVAAARYKIKVVGQDEKESDQRRLLNLGHTFGHALEAATRYEVFLHGEAVFLGLRAAVALSHAHGLLSTADATQLDDLLAPVPVPRATVEVGELLAALEQDKKTRERQLHWILLKRPGEAIISSDVAPDAVGKVAEWICEIAASGRAMAATSKRPRILVLNGPNLNLLGEREPEIYGRHSYDELEDRLQVFAAEQAVELLVRQTNVEGDLVGLIQQARFWADGIVLNPGGYTHTSVAIRDAIAAVTLPVIEVHLTDIGSREEFRRNSLISPVCRRTIAGGGIEGYFDAVRDLKSVIEMPHAERSSAARAIS